MAPLGGYRQSPVGTDTDLSQLQHGSWVTFHGFLELFGANVFNPSTCSARARWPRYCRSARHYANFVVTDGPGSWAGMPRSVRLTFGQPARTYHVDGFTVQVWN